MADEQEVNSPVSDHSEEQPVEHVKAPQAFQAVPYKPWNTARSLALHTLLWAQFFWTLLCQAGATTQTITRGVVRSLQSQVYVFFQGSAYPYRIQDYTLSGPGVPPIEWYYDADKKMFISFIIYNTTTEYESHHFEWLSGQIKYNNLMLQDISEYLQQAKWVGASRPSATVLVSAWSLHSGTVLHLSEGLRLHTINQDATESVLPICG